MKITFWGVRGSIPVAGPQTTKYGGNTSCVELRLDDGGLIIFDAGTGIRLLGKKLMKEKRPLNFHLLLSHAHTDHVNGFPFFSPAYVRHNHLTIAGCPRAGKQVKDMLRRQMGDIFFPLEYDGLPAKMEHIIYCRGDVLRIRKARVFTREINHPGEGIAFKIVERRKTVVYLTDNELMRDVPPAFPFEDFVDFVRGVDLLIHDTQYSPHEYRTFAKGWGHSTYEDSARLAVKGGVKKLVIFHHDPDHNDRKVDWMVEKTRAAIRKMGGQSIRCVGAREGKTLNV